MRAVAPEIMRHMRYVLAMPNNGPVRTVEEALAYYAELLPFAEQTGRKIDLIMTVYHTDLTTPAMIEQIAASSVVRAVKHYPPHKGATTGSGYGIPLEDSHAMLRAMEETGVPLLGHFETVYDASGRELPSHQREAHMVDTVLWRLRDKYPNLRICFEHASTQEAVEFVEADTSGRTVMTVTPQHSLFTKADFEEHGTDLKCMPIVKTPEDRAAIVDFITSGDRRAIAGDDTAPHLSKTKRTAFEDAANGCWLPHAIGLYATAFNRAGALDHRFERFMSLNGPEWWGLPAPDERDVITLVRTSSRIPEPTRVPEEDDVVVPLGWKGTPDQMRVEFTVE